ncbi:ribosomal protein rpl35 [Cystoisospora suis]|uniref:50S ribosomal protein L35 n=1 Tax=Cystoisospora suis TaxID=483139 RepID=A0A2C6JYY9_9APIC|nr:ribosomal protein rpl35 [Cystoisospora suis]
MGARVPSSRRLFLLSLLSLILSFSFSSPVLLALAHQKTSSPRRPSLPVPWRFPAHLPSLSLSSYSPAPLSSLIVLSRLLTPNQPLLFLLRPLSETQKSRTRPAKLFCGKTLFFRADVGTREISSSSISPRYSNGSNSVSVSSIRRSSLSTENGKILFPTQNVSTPGFLPPSTLLISLGRTRDQADETFFSSSSCPSPASFSICMKRAAEMSGRKTEDTKTRHGSRRFSSERRRLSSDSLPFLHHGEELKSPCRREKLSELFGENLYQSRSREGRKADRQFQTWGSNIRSRKSIEEGQPSLSSALSSCYRSGVGSLEMKVKIPTPALKPRTRKSIAKRFKITATGKLLYRHSGRQHLMRKKQGQRRRRLRKVSVLTGKMASKFLSCIHTARARIRRRKKMPQPVYKA